MRGILVALASVALLVPSVRTDGTNVAGAASDDVIAPTCNEMFAAVDAVLGPSVRSIPGGQFTNPGYRACFGFAPGPDRSTATHSFTVMSATPPYLSTLWLNSDYVAPANAPVEGMLWTPNGYSALGFFGEGAAARGVYYPCGIGAECYLILYRRDGNLAALDADIFEIVKGLTPSLVAGSPLVIGAGAGPPLLADPIVIAAPVGASTPTPICEGLLAAVESVTGPPGMSPGYEETPAYSRCFGNVLTFPVGYSFEIWSFASGARPAQLPPGDYVAVDDPAAPVPGMTWTARVSTSGIDASRSVFFPCGGGECWLYLDVVGSAGPELETAIFAIAAQLAGGAPAPAPSEPWPRPNCVDLAALLPPILDALAPVDTPGSPLTIDPPGESLTPDLSAQRGVLCGGTGSRSTTSGGDPAASSLSIGYALIAAVPGSQLAQQATTILHITQPLVASPTGSGLGTLTDGGFVAAGSDWNGSPDDDSVVTSRVVQYPCGALECWLRVAIWSNGTSYAVALDFVDAVAARFITASSDYIASLPPT